MSFEWDRLKAAQNFEKHGVAFELAALIFGSTTLETPDRRRDYGEARFRAIGEVDGAVLFVVYTYRGSARRIISARRASSEERERYRALLAARSSAGEGS
jgi:uncharacterized protein